MTDDPMSDQQPDVVEVIGAGGAHVGTITLGDASPLAVIAQLGERLWYAERALALAGATAEPPPTEMGNAALQAWWEWAHLYGTTAAAITEDEIRALAQARTDGAARAAAPTEPVVTDSDETAPGQDQSTGDSPPDTPTGPEPATERNRLMEAARANLPPGLELVDVIMPSAGAHPGEGPTFVLHHTNDAPSSFDGAAQAAADVIGQIRVPAAMLNPEPVADLAALVDADLAASIDRQTGGWYGTPPYQADAQAARNGEPVLDDMAGQPGDDEAEPPC